MSAEKPFLWAYLVITIHVTLLLLVSPYELYRGLKIVFYFSHLATIVWFLLKAIKSFQPLAVEQLRFSNARKKETGRKNDMIPEENLIFFLHTLMILIVITAILFFFNYLIPDITKFILASSASLAAVAIVLKGNVVTYTATLTLIVSKIFKVGIWVTGSHGGVKFDGNIMKIGLRETHVRLWNQGIAIIPNTAIVDSVVINNSERMVRQINLDLYLPSSVAESVAEMIRKEIFEYISNHKYISRKSSYDNSFKLQNGFSDTLLVDFLDKDNGYRINVYCYVNQDNWVLQRKVTSEIVLKSSSIARNHGVDIVSKSNHVEIMSVEGPKMQAEIAFV